MAIKELKREWCPSQLAYVKEFLLHREEELQHMPRCSVGSKATVSETDNEYVKTTDGWKLLCDCDEDGGQGAGSGGAFVVNVTSVYDEQVGDYVYTADKTKAEIESVLENGGSITCAYYEEANGERFYAGMLRDGYVDWEGNVVLHGLDGIGTRDTHRYGLRFTDNSIERLDERYFMTGRLYISSHFFMTSQNGTLWRVMIGDDGKFTAENLGAFDI